MASPYWAAYINHSSARSRAIAGAADTAGLDDATLAPCDAARRGNAAGADQIGSWAMQFNSGGGFGVGRAQIRLLTVRRCA
jgi:hypothetical protein